MLRLCAASILLICAATWCFGQLSGPMLFSRLTVNRTHIAFSYAGDIWVVERAGGEARRLTTNPGEENFPVFSPDGSQLAFSRQVGGNWDVYVMPVAGGEARRLTFDPRGEFVAGWKPDGQSILFDSNANLNPQLFTISLNAVMPNALPLPKALVGSFSPNGARIAYTPMGGVSDWRFYRGGSRGQIWLANLSDGAVEKLPQGNYNDDQPMWVGDKIYFVSDRTSAYNLYAYDITSKQTKQLTSYEQYGIRWTAAGGGVIAFVRDGHIHIYDPISNQTRMLDVRVSPDTPELKARTVNAARTIEWTNLSGNGDRIFFGTRGEVLQFEPGTGESKNLTQTASVAERYPALSPDGRSLAYFSDESGEYQLHIQPLDGGATKKIAIELRPSFYRELTWSADSKKLAFTDKRLGLWCADVERGTTRRVDKSTYSYQEEWFPNWSADGRWLAYSKHLQNRMRTAYIYDAESGQTHQLTDGHSHVQSPVFDRNGKYLYFISSANAGTSEFGWGVLNSEMARPLVTRRLHVVILQDDQPVPIMPGGPNPEAHVDAVLSKMRIDFENLAERIIDLTVPPGDYEQLVAGKPGVFYVLANEWPKSPTLGASPARTLYLVDLSKPAKLEKLVEEVRSFDISPDGTRLLYFKGRPPDGFLVSAAAAPKSDEGKLDFKRLQVSIDPRAEWKQMYHESWRIMRDWFYDPNHHGQNLAELERHYGEYLPGIVRRSDLNSLLNRMLGHISVSHLGVGGGDLPQPVGPPDRTGMLGADYDIDHNRYRFKQIYRTSYYNSPSGFTPGPLDLPGRRVKEGEYLLAIDEQNIDASKSIYSYFDGKAGQRIKIKVGPTPDGAGARTLTIPVLPGQAENQIRRANWSENNRRTVERLSGGKLGYVYVESYGPGIMDFIRGLTGYSDRQGLIIDQRFNGGGITPDYLIEWLRRKPIYYYTFREGDDIAVPVNPGPAVKVLIVNENNFSAAETFAFMYKLARVGPIVGLRTGGGGIGPYVFTPDLIDGGSVQLPNRAAYNPDGTSWGVENSGIQPDFEAEITPKDWMTNRDPQLEKAVAVAMEELKKLKPEIPKKPKYPVHK